MKVTVYSTPTCPWCKKVKQFLDEHDVEYEDIDVSSDQEKAQAMIKLSGQMGVPVVDIDGEITVGYDEKTLKKLLKL